MASPELAQTNESRQKTEKLKYILAKAHTAP